jgi:hypothetical protein
LTVIFAIVDGAIAGVFWMVSRLPSPKFISLTKILDAQPPLCGSRRTCGATLHARSRFRYCHPPNNLLRSHRSENPHTRQFSPVPISPDIHWSGISGCKCYHVCFVACTTKKEVHMIMNIARAL